MSSEQEEKQRPQPIQGLSSAGGRFAIVASRFNTLIVDRLLEGALEAFSRCGTPADRVGVLRVPGAFELPLAASRLAASENYDALVALGCVVRGETPHFDHVSRAATDGLERVSLDFGIPIGFGVLTTEDMAQARARSGGESGDMGSNRGFDAALAAIQMFQLLREV